MLPTLFLVSTGIARGEATASDLSPAACYLLFLSGARGEVSHGHDTIKLETVDGCTESSCWQPYEEAGSGHLCGYGRGADLALGIEDSPKAARQLVRQKMKTDGLRQVFKKQPRVADVAGMKFTSKGTSKEGTILMAVGKTTAGFILSWGSDKNTSATWPNVRHELIEDAHEIAVTLHQPGCPASLAECH
jgi:hypothetical protein